MAVPIRRYTGDRRSPSPSGRITLDTRVIIANFSARYAEIITRVSLDLRQACGHLQRSPVTCCDQQRLPRGSRPGTRAVPPPVARPVGSVLVSFAPVQGRSPANAGRLSALVAHSPGRWRMPVRSPRKRVRGQPLRGFKSHLHRSAGRARSRYSRCRHKSRVMRITPCGCCPCPAPVARAGPEALPSQPVVHNTPGELNVALRSFAVVIM